MYTLTSQSAPRITPPGGMQIAGRHFPQGVSSQAFMVKLDRRSHNFADYGADHGIEQ